jgi:hypothetical protein
MSIENRLGIEPVMTRSRGDGAGKLAFEKVSNLAYCIQIREDRLIAGVLAQVEEIYLSPEEAEVVSGNMEDIFEGVPRTEDLTRKSHTIEVLTEDLPLIQSRLNGLGFTRV